MISVSIKRATGPLCAALLALGVSACATRTTVSSFKGEQRAVAQVVADLQSYGTAGEAQKICTDLLAGAVTARLRSAPGGCKQALKGQLSQVDTPEVTVEKVHLHGATGATAEVKSVYSGKTTLTDVTLVKEDGAWKILKLG
ncbi:MAG: hypothetical protein ACRDK7_14915 [Solirubrobacteraceae bacterium]